MNLRKVKAGNPLKIPAKAFNTFVDTARECLPRRQVGMWVRAAAKAIVKKSVAVYVEKVYEEGNFSTLGIGT